MDSQGHAPVPDLPADADAIRSYGAARSLYAASASNSSDRFRRERPG
jgi:hypothetical protein